jgi:hypothetical protein
MKCYNYFFALLLLLGMVLYIPSDVRASEVKQGDKITIVVPGTVARLCPYPNCGENQHITRIPQGTVLTVEGIMEIKSGMMPPVPWFEVTYKGKRGWTSIYNTDKAQ